MSLFQTLLEALLPKQMIFDVQQWLIEHDYDTKIGRSIDVTADGRLIPGYHVYGLLQDTASAKKPKYVKYHIADDQEHYAGIAAFRPQNEPDKHYDGGVDDIHELYWETLWVADGLADLYTNELKR